MKKMTNRSKIILLRDVPVGLEHKCFKGRVFDVIPNKQTGHIWIVSATGAEVKLMPDEYDYLNEGKQYE